ncbi:MAG TPA: hypothetical protein VN772_04355, partial [Solirubrobacteraceae bacterium]|nr:hypothetical protein [Solirubrobacteraceae bacterium]
MSAGPPTSAAGAREPWGWLPQRLRPREAELPGSGRQWLIETTLLVLVGVLLAVATFNDVARQTGVNERLIADIATWRAYTGHPYHDLGVDQELLGANSRHEVVCGNTVPGAPKAKTQICLLVWGPVVAGRRTVHGGWYLPPRSEDARSERYGCFGSAR